MRTRVDACAVAFGRLLRRPQHNQTHRFFSKPPYHGKQTRGGIEVWRSFPSRSVSPLVLGLRQGDTLSVAGGVGKTVYGCRGNSTSCRSRLYACGQEICEGAMLKCRLCLLLFTRHVCPPTSRCPCAMPVENTGKQPPGPFKLDRPRAQCQCTTMQWQCGSDECPLCLSMASGELQG